MGYEETENRFETEEGLTADEAKVRGMLGGMKRVETPKDFGFKVQARIANVRPETFREKRGFGVLGYAMPLGLVLVVTSAFIINSVYNVGDNTVPPVAGVDMFQQPIVSPGAPQSNEVARVVPGEPRSDSTSGPDANTLAVNPNRPSREKKTGDSKDSGGGSRDMTQERPLPFFQPPGAQSNTTGSPGEVVARGQIAVRAVLEIVGIRADFADQGWKVRAVEKNSVAERSGVKSGDLIEAINGLPVTDGTQFSGRFIGKNLRVNRDGNTVEIDLK